MIIAETIQMLVKSIRFYPYLGRKSIKLARSQSRDKILYVLLGFVLYPVTIIIDKAIRQFCQVHDFHLASLCSFIKLINERNG